jgi:protein-disulfide isomerase
MAKQRTKSKISKKIKWIISILAIAAIVTLIFFLLPSGSQVQKLSIGNSPVLGEENAPVTIYEFSDFSCPYCEAAEGANAYYVNALKSKFPGWEAPVPLIKENYVQTGKVKSAFKYYPGHGAAGAAHAVALGLKEQSNDLFWKFAEKAFAMPDDLNDINKMIDLAKTIGANETLLSKYISAKKYQAQMDEDIAMGQANGVQGTPTFFINGQVVEGAQLFSVFQEIIENDLK